MPLAEVVTIEVGTAIAKYILKLWLKDSSLGQGISSSLIDLLKAKTADRLAQREGNRQFEKIGEKVGSHLVPFFQQEGAQLDEGDRTTVAYAVADTFNQSTLSTEVLLQHNLEPTHLAQYVFASHPLTTRDLNQAATDLYRRIIKEACTCIVDIASQLPAFSERSIAEVLKREDLIVRKVDQILADLQKIQERLDPMIEAERFEIEYRQAVARNLDILQLIGADVSLPNRRHRLSVAYITLSVEQTWSELPLIREQFDKVAGIEVEDKAEEGDIVSVNTALASSRRLLISGSPGSGKTTLLQWVAVRAATRSSDEELRDWNMILPFYIRLRHYVQSALPRPEAFPIFAAPAIVDMMPRGWVHTVLKSGRALVLVDGVDEVPESQREEMHTWLNDLVETYPHTYFLVTSRPHAIQAGWMSHHTFNKVELQPMERADISLFIDHWHDAVREELQTDEDKHELDPLAQHLKDQIKRHRAIQTLATTPLLCAMLCALNRDRRRHLPVNRVELYRACCELLLERREKESRIDGSDYPALNLGQKERLLQDLAYWMIQEKLSEADLTQVDARFSQQLAHMPNLPYDISSTAIRRLLVERSGIIREPVTGQIDFAHRTFEEFFAAQAALDVGDIDLLVSKAPDDQWREVIILAAGLASQPVCEQLIAGLLKRGDEEKASRHQIHLLAVSCLETAIQLRPEIRKEVEKRLSQLVPPKNMTEAKELAVAGELAVKHLTKKGKLSVTTCAACIRTLGLIGSDAALDMLEEYTSDTRQTVIKELVKVWDLFDKEEFGKRILSQMAKKNAAILTYLDLSGYKQLTDVRPFANLSNLASLNLSWCEQLTDVSPLASLSNLIYLDLSGCKQLTDVSPLASLGSLTNLNLSGCEQLTDVSPLASLGSLTSLLARYEQLTDMSPLVSLTNLTSLTLFGCEQLTDVSPLASLGSLTDLDLSGCKQLTDVSPLASLGSLTYLTLSGCEQLTDVSPLASLTNLTSLTLFGCEQLTDVSPLASLTNLTSLTLFGCEQLTDVSPLASLSILTDLHLFGCKQLTDVSPLASLTNLTSLTLFGCKQLTDVSPLASLSTLTSLSLPWCEQLTDVSPLASLTNLTSLNLSVCKQLTDVSPLASLSNLKIYR